MRWWGVAVRTKAAREAFSRRLSLAFLLAAMMGFCAPAVAESQHCAELRAQIARAGRGQAERLRAVAAKQRVEYGRLSAKGRAMHCDREQFLIFGDAPPPQCGPLNARLRTLYDSISANESAAANGDSDTREALLTRYNDECRNTRARAGGPRNFFEELFGVAPPDETTGLREVPVEPPTEDTREFQDDPQDETPMGGSQAVCVRTCDGGFFPMSTKARASNLDELESLCKALCPNAEVRLFTRAPFSSLEGAVAINGETYSTLPNALKFQTSYDPSCGCKPPDKSWAEALEDAERILAERHKNDQVVTEEEAEKLSQPLAPNDPRLKKQKRSRTEDATATPAPPLLKPSVVEGAAESGRETYKEVVGPDGVKRRVRVVAPSL